MRIAIVDDIKEERDKLADVLTKQLSRRGIHVNLFEFENGEDFLIAAKERPFTVVFSGHLHEWGKWDRDCQRASDI